MKCLYCGKSTKVEKNGEIRYNKFCIGTNCLSLYKKDEFNKKHNAKKCECCGKDLFDYNGRKLLSNAKKRFCNKSCKMKIINPMNNGNVYDHWVNKYGKEKAKELEKKRLKIQSKKASKKLKGIKIKDHFIKRFGESVGKSKYDEYIKNQKKVQAISQQKRWDSDEGRRLKEEFSKMFSGKNNPMYGKPTPVGSGNGWSGWFEDFYFRSLKELKFLLICKRFNIAIKSAEKETFRINYTDWKGTKRTSIPDYIVEDKYIIEIKPKHLQKSFDNKAKFIEFEKLAKSKGMKFKVIDSGRMDLDIFLELYDSRKIQLIDKYKDKLNEYIKTKNKKSKNSKVQNRRFI